MYTNKIPLKSGVEQDALTGWRKITHFRVGERKFAKRKYNRRLRSMVKSEIKEFLDSLETPFVNKKRQTNNTIYCPACGYRGLKLSHCSPCPNCGIETPCS